MTSLKKNSDVRFESRDADWRRLLLAAAGTAVMLGVVLALIWAIYGDSLQLPGHAGDSQSSFTQGSDWENRVAREREVLWAEDKRRLTTYRWLDRETGILQVPIEEALRAIDQHGVPVWRPVQTPETSPYSLSTNDS